MKIITLGAPGAGKGTRTKKIAVKYQIPHISIGDIFRANIKNGTEPGMKTKPYMDAGDPVPGKITIGMLLDRIHKEGCKNEYALDGFPRAIPRVESFTKALGDMGEAADYTVDVDVPDENIINRVSGRRACLSCGVTYHIVYNSPKREGVCDVYGQQLILRDGDKPETVKKRLDVYHDQTQSFIEYYKKTGALAGVDGTLDMEEAFQAVVRILGT